MDPSSNHIYIKLGILSIAIISFLYFISYQTNHYGLNKIYSAYYRTLNNSQILEMVFQLSRAGITNHTTITTTTTTTMISTTTSSTKTTITTTTTVSTTTTTGLPTTLDPAELLVQRPPPASRTYNKDSKIGITAFVFHTQHHILANLQLYLIRKFATNLVAIELFTDGPASDDMKSITDTHKAILHSYPSEKHGRDRGPSDRNTDVVNWALSTRAKQYLSNNTAILLLDGDVFPLSPFDATTLLHEHDVICRKHPALFARFCWIGFICLNPYLHDKIDNFSVSQDMRAGKAYDSGGKTAEFLLKHPNVSFAWMKETVFLGMDKNLFWGAVDGDIQWIGQNFGRCDKCGPEIFFSQFDDCDAVFYHMISATSEWRFGHQGPRRQAIHDSIMRSPYGPNQTYSPTDIIESVKKVQKMQTIPYFGNLTCEKVCGR